jgi:hypothetical protein
MGLIKERLSLMSAQVHRFKKMSKFSGCFLGPDFVTIIRHDETDDWPVMKAELFAVLTDFFDSNLPIINEDALPNQDTIIYDDDVMPGFFIIFRLLRQF